jgi:CRP-like cAMP-binding protein
LSERRSAGSADALSQARAAGDVLFREGDGGNELYIVERGRLEITRRRGDGDGGVRLRVVGEKELVGEMAFLRQHSHRDRDRDGARRYRGDRSANGLGSGLPRPQASLDAHARRHIGFA